MKTLFTLIIISYIFLFNSVLAQPTIVWQRCFGGADSESGSSIQQTIDGGYILVGTTNSNDGDVIGNHGGSDVFVAKLNSIGVIEWKKCLGGTADDNGRSIQQTIDGGYILVGTTNSNDGDVIGNHGGSDVWIVKLSSFGIIQWQKCLGGTTSDYGSSIKQTIDGGYVITGWIYSNNGDVSGNHGSGDAWVVKLSSFGNIQWQKCLGGSKSDGGRRILQTNDGGYFLIGFTVSNNGNVSGNHGGSTTSYADAWVVKLNTNGDFLWQKCLGGTNDDNGFSAKETIDEGFIIAAWTRSNDGDVNGNHGGHDAWVVKLSSTGAIQWQKCLGGVDDDFGNSIELTIEGGFIIAGSTNSNDGDVTGNHGTSDVWIVNLSSTGATQSQKCYGGNNSESCSFIHRTADGDFILIGITRSVDGDVSGNLGQSDVWVIKLSPVITESAAMLANPSSFQITPNPATGSIILKTAANFVGRAYQVFNMQGKTVMIGQITAEEMPLSTEDLPAGIYTILASGQAIRLVKE
jgi:hypothetical protein